MGEDGVTECARGERGEIWVHAPNVTQGYWRNESATRSTITREGWLKTGDVGFVDEGGKWFVVDRMKVQFFLSFFRCRRSSTFKELKIVCDSRGKKCKNEF